MTRTVLVIDDLFFYRRRLRNLLRELGYRVNEAGAGPAGVELAERINPDVVLLDEVMPGCDSKATLAALRELGCPVVVLSPRVDAACARGFMDLGAHSVVAKTATRDEFQSALRAVFDQAAAA